MLPAGGDKTALLVDVMDGAQRILDPEIVPKIAGLQLTALVTGLKLQNVLGGQGIVHAQQPHLLLTSIPGFNI